ncbi:cytochrome c family protein [Hyphomicrobium sp. CS1GBMeth3]|uniref:c-type cytochrome n=1 Tax=Hyphomicrobium sp. CS1GBMeth3 TaxID=1892845 RepID=UPI0009300AE6|nr:cytochrome c family protein [Hyphomicrobium sp. CS1GBMeth3]
MLKWVVAAAAVLAVPFSASAQDAEAGKAVFKKCAACHQIGPDAKNGLGPSLQCVAGQKAGHLEDFNYSKAVKESDITWDDEHLLKWFEKDDAVIKGNKMIFPAGIKNEEDRANLLAYIKSECKQ